MVITTLSVVDGASAHITAQVLDQYGNVMPGLDCPISDPGPNTSFTPDAGVDDAGTVTGLDVGSDTITASYGNIGGSLPVTVTAAPSVATSIQFTSP